ncbi:fused response regulator/phosphatase [Streptomyces sp. NBC_01465]|uniref:fused response regulator/phosphatase n=1 Tax=Streptomyces sp. NBC_01465 TaxID=2903878 RepID=UPI002E31324D|nr:fused response regulator/phosphatase [Streptomyces sp. NBC_01465]
MNATTDASTVLVVDDIDANRMAMGAVLHRAGHGVVHVASAGAALIELDARYRAGALPDAALLDVGLPDMDGFELCRRMKSHPEISSIPVVHFSAAAVAPGDRSRGLDAGGEGYFTVPVEPEEIQAVVRAALRGARSRVAAVAQADRLTRLAAATTEVHSAHSAQELVDVAADAVAQITGGPAVVFAFGADGRLHVGSPTVGAHLPDASAQAAVALLLQRGMAGRTGIRRLLAPFPLWPVGYFPADGTGAAHLVLARSRVDHPPVCLAVPRHPGPTTDTESLLGLLAHATSLAAESLRTYAEERRTALTLQRSFLPRTAPELPGAELALRYVPATRNAEIGGDFYTALTTPSGLLVGVGDVVGHSLEAATVMVELRHALRAYAADEQDPVSLVTRLDRMLQLYHPEATATVCLALIEPCTGRALIANAGHIQPLIVPDDGTPHFIDCAGPLLGLGLEHPPPTAAQLARTDRLLMVTDGLIETRGTDLARSIEDLRSAAAAAPAGVAQLCDTLLARFGHREDDVALLALRLVGQPDTASFSSRVTP